ncbi:tail fiber protein [bacterium]|nr:tail fiber protein [bacterium]
MASKESFTGSITIFGGDFRRIPTNWAHCLGNELPRKEYAELFEVIGTQFGAPTADTFKLPNIQDRLVIGTGRGPGLTARNQGDVGGQKKVELEADHLPAHKHRVYCFPNPIDIFWKKTPGSYYPAPNNDNFTNYGTGHEGRMNETMITNLTQPQSHENRQPYYAAFYIICVKGINPYG